MDEPYTLTTARYIELNPVKAGIMNKANDYTWSSAKAHLLGEDDILVKVKPLLELISDWQEFLSINISDEKYEILTTHERTGSPLGSASFVEQLESLTSRILKRQKPGPQKEQ